MSQATLNVTFDSEGSIFNWDVETLGEGIAIDVSSRTFLITATGTNLVTFTATNFDFDPDAPITFPPGGTPSGVFHNLVSSTELTLSIDASAAPTFVNFNLQREGGPTFDPTIVVDPH